MRRASSVSSQAGGADGASSPPPRFDHVKGLSRPRIRRRTFTECSSSDPGKQYDMKEILARILDGSRFEEYRSEIGKTLLCGYGRIGGLVRGDRCGPESDECADDRPGYGPAAHRKFGGVIYTESAEKAARFILDCNQHLVPLIFLHDVNGFMVGKEAEWSGIIRAGAQMVNAMANSVVPKISVILGGTYGAGYYAMCGKAYDPRFLWAWPTARYAVMSGDSAADTLAQIKAKQMERDGTQLSAKELGDLRKSVLATYEEQTNPRYAASRLWTDAILDPAHTRRSADLRAGCGCAEHGDR